MAGEHELAAPFTVHGKRPVVLASDWRPVPIGNKVSIVPACGDGRIPVVPNTRKVCFRHRTLEMDHIPEFVRPVLLYSRELYTTTDYGVCGTKLMRGSPVARRVLETVVASVVRMAKHGVFPTDLKLGNFVYFWTLPSVEGIIGTARYIDLDQFGCSHSGWRSCSFFLIVASLEHTDPDLYEAALAHPDILTAFYQAQKTIEGEPPHCTALLGMNLLMRAIIALLNFQLGAAVEIPPELLVDPDDEVYWKCYVGGSAFFDTNVVV